MLYILVTEESSRINYTCQVLFGMLLNLDYKIIKSSDAEHIGKSEIIINYATQPKADTLTVPESGFLAKNPFEITEPPIRFDGPNPLLFPQNLEDPQEASLQFDLFAACFFLLSGYEYHYAKQYDEHGRYDEKSLFSFQNKLHKYPWVHHYANLLRDELSRIFPNLPDSPAPNFDYEVTFDIDRPWLFRHKTWLSNGLGLVKNMLAKEPNLLKARWKTLMKGQKDPYDTYDTILKHCSPSKTRFFFLMRQGKMDNPLTPYNKHFQRLIDRIATSGYQLGLHPSYEAAEDRYLLWAEHFLLAHFTGQNIDASRQHYLRHWIPNTPKKYLEAGLVHDYSACLVSDTGFKYGMAQPFPWYDLETESTNNLHIHPTMVMDRTLKQYLNLTPEAGSEHIRDVLGKTRDVGGKFVILLHNESLSDFGEWKGWRSVFLDAIDQLNKG